MADGRFQHRHPSMTFDTDGMMIGEVGALAPCGLRDRMVVVSFNEEQARQPKRRKGTG